MTDISIDDITSQLPGKIYVVAVSGGVDSMALLHMLVVAQVESPQGHRLTVAHFDHGIRTDSSLDRQLVARAAHAYGIPFVYDEGKLGPGTSEADARSARYAFLNKVLAAAHADGIITAHHQDDRIETAIINLLRGTNRRGLSSLASTPQLVRPLLNIPKQKLYEYAKANHITWREDVTNVDTTYTRNHIRHNIVPKLTTADRERLLGLLDQTAKTNHELDATLTHVAASLVGEQGLNRSAFASLPDNIAQEVVATWLRQNGVNNYDRRTIQRVANGIKSLTTGKQIDVISGVVVRVGRTHAMLLALN